MSYAGARPRILIAEPHAFDAGVEALLRRHAEVVMDPISQEGLAAAFESFDAVWVRLGLRVDASAIGPAPRCRVIACPATGLDHIDLVACEAQQVRVVSLKGEHEFLRSVRATAELTICLMLALLRKLPAAAGSVLAGSWDRDRFRGRELHGKTVGLVGVGRLGVLVSEMLSGFGVELIGYDPRPDFPECGVRRATSLDEVLTVADVVSLHVSYGPSTHHLIGREQLGLLRPEAVLINTSRGGVVDEVALLDALAEGRIAGAALDVLQGEPTPALTSSPLVDFARTHDSLIIVPHIGGNTWESTSKTELFIARKLLEALSVGVSA